MNLYSCIKFKGFYDSGVAAIIFAMSPNLAAKHLNKELIKIGLQGNTTKHDIVLVQKYMRMKAQKTSTAFHYSNIKSRAIILNDGNY